MCQPRRVPSPKSSVRIFNRRAHAVQKVPPWSTPTPCLCPNACPDPWAHPTHAHPHVCFKDGKFTSAECEEVLQKYDYDLSCAESFLFKSADGSAPPAETTQLLKTIEEIGFPRSEAAAALQHCNNDLNATVTYLLSKQAPDPGRSASPPVEPEPGQRLSVPPGNTLLGLELSEGYVRRLTNHALLDGLVHPIAVDYTESHIMGFTAAQLRQSMFLAVHPGGPSSSQSTGRIGVVAQDISPKDDSVSITVCEHRAEFSPAVPTTLHIAVDPCAAAATTSLNPARKVSTASVRCAQLALQPDPFRKLMLWELLPSIRQRHRDLAIAYSRRVLQLILTQLPTPLLQAVTPALCGLDLPAFQQAEVYRILKTLSLPVFYEMQPIFNSAGLDLARHAPLQELAEALPKLHVHCAGTRRAAQPATVPLWRVAMTGALQETARVCDIHPHLRVVCTTLRPSGQARRLHLPHATSIAIAVAHGSELPTASDSLTFYMDAACTKTALALNGPMTFGSHTRLFRILPCNKVWYVSRSSGANFTFFVTPASLACPERHLLSCPNMPLAALVLSAVVQSPQCALRPAEVTQVWTAAVHYLLLPFAPVKVQFAGLLQALFHRYHRQALPPPPPTLLPLGSVTTLRRELQAFFQYLPLGSASPMEALPYPYPTLPLGLALPLPYPSVSPYPCPTPRPCCIPTLPLGLVALLPYLSALPYPTLSLGLAAPLPCSSALPRTYPTPRPRRTPALPLGLAVPLPYPSASPHRYPTPRPRRTPTLPYPTLP